MSARNELARIVSEALGNVTGIYDTTDDEDREIADAILAAGYRKPQQVTTVQELDALPVGSVVRTDRAGVYEKGCFPDEPDFPYWLVTGMSREFASLVLSLPATVLHEPTP